MKGNELCKRMWTFLISLSLPRSRPGLSRNDRSFVQAKRTLQRETCDDEDEAIRNQGISRDTEAVHKILLSSQLMSLSRGVERSSVRWIVRFT